MALLITPSVGSAEVVIIGGAEFATLNLGGVAIGTVAASTATVRTGVYSARIVPTGTNTGAWRMNGLTTTGDLVNIDKATTYDTFYFRYATKPASDEEEMWSANFSATVTDHKYSLRLDSDGNVNGYNADGTLTDSGTTVLSANTWYKIQISVGTSATVGAYELKINDVTEFSGTTNTSATNHFGHYFGKIVNQNGQSVEFFYDDIHIDDSVFLAGDKIIRINPVANGSTMQWTGGTNGSDYQEVDETLLDSDTTYVQSVNDGDVALFDLTDTATAGISGNVYAVFGAMYIKETGVDSQATIRFRSGSTNSNSTTFNQNTNYTAKMKILDEDPDTTSEWTISAIDALEFGAVQTDVSGGTESRLTQAAVEVLWAEAGGGEPAAGEEYIIIFD